MPSIFWHVKSEILSDGTGVNGFKCMNDEEDGNAEHSSSLQMRDTDN
jgi:hypothetical protein